MATQLVDVNRQGRLTLPAQVRRALHLPNEGATLQWEVVDGAVVLRPVVVVPAEDAWAYTPEALASIARARQNAREGRVFRLTKDQFLALIEQGRRDDQSVIEQIESINKGVSREP